jgi:hypothetical protein
MRLQPYGSVGTHEVSRLVQMGPSGWRDPARAGPPPAKGCEVVGSCGPGQAPGSDPQIKTMGSVVLETV